MSSHITEVVMNGTKLVFNVSGRTIDVIYRKVRKDKLVRKHQGAMLFYSRKTRQLVDVRYF